MSPGPKMTSASSTPSVSLSASLFPLSLSRSEEVKWGMDEGSITPTPRLTTERNSVCSCTHSLQRRCRNAKQRNKRTPDQLALPRPRVSPTEGLHQCRRPGSLPSMHLCSQATSAHSEKCTPSIKSKSIVYQNSLCIGL